MPQENTDPDTLATMKNAAAATPDHGHICYWLLFAVVLMETFAVFANGAYFLVSMTVCVVGSWALLAGALYARGGAAVLFLDRAAAFPLHLMAAFWVWVGASIFWAHAPDLAWIEFNRTGGYLALLAIGILVGAARMPRHLPLLLFLLVTVAGSAYGLGAKLFPSLIENTDSLARISVPMGYTNAMGLLAALGVPLALSLAVNAATGWYYRLIAAASLPLLFISLFFTVSRGAMLALCIGLLVMFMVAPARLRILAMLLLALVPAVLVSWWGNNQEALMLDKADLGLRLQAAGPLRLYTAIAIASVSLTFVAALLAGARVSFPSWVRNTAGVVIITALVCASVLHVWFFLAEKPSTTEWARDAYHEFTTGKTSKLGAARLLQVGSQGRFRLWQEAMDNWSDNRLAGTGAQSFPLVHLQRQDFDSPFVKQPHGLPFRLLTELGAAGFIIGYLAIAAISVSSLMLVCSLRPRRWDRLYASGLITFMTVYLVHSGYDWDWNMFALTAGYFFLGGLCIGWQTMSHCEVGGRSRGRRYHQL
ncbi:MAG: hypothetical protein C4534_04820 [Gaiellales bacterium]|nr:MAG: hypothetical protein C4534_04820 [Gaiellales bacterium]